MRGLIVLGMMMLALPAAAQNTAITVPTTPCADPPKPAAAAAPVTPSIAAGVAAARSRDFALALANFKPLAEQGDANAELAMGQLLMQNCTGLQDKPAAVEWLNKAATAGNIPARNLLGLAYMTGHGVPLDDNKAFALFSQTAAAGNAVGEMELGYLYTAGRGVPQDKYQGLQWTVKAAEQGNATALGNIANAYMHGEILEKDTDRAAYFLALTNERSTPAQRAEFMGISLQIRQEVSASDLARATSRAQRWSPGAGSLRDVLSDADDFRR
ncbi:MAG TPA: tetratricopeptide repeat protein, partial [Rhizomicrobium sp.]|nr:tetratricopeptide repeat protein [Rhizomicrobium sp.]